MSRYGEEMNVGKLSTFQYLCRRDATLPSNCTLLQSIERITLKGLVSKICAIN